MTPALILAALLAQPVYLADRADSPEARAALLEPVAEAIAGAVRTPEDAALLIALGNHETHFARAVLTGHCEQLGRAACDHGRARGTWQQWRAACRSAYAFEAGSPESLKLEARCAIANLHAAGHRCALRGVDRLIGSFSGYAGGASCAAGWADERVATYRRVLARLENG